MKRAALAGLVALAASGCADHDPLQPSPNGASLAVSASSSDGILQIAPVTSSIGGLNNAGDVSGFTRNGFHAFLWSDGVLTELGPVAGDSRAQAWGINDAGQIVGGTVVTRKAFIWEEGVGFTVIGDGWAEAINDAPGRMVVGGGDNGPRVWEFDGSEWIATDLPVDPGTGFRGYAGDVNETGEVVGTEAVNGEFSATLWTRTGSTWTKTTLPTVAGDAWSIAYGINDAGQISGTASTSAGNFAIRWDDGIPQVLPPLPDDVSAGAYMLNANGDVAGSSGLTPVIWRDQVPIVLPSAEGASFCYAVRINDVGQAGGECRFGNQRYAVVWELGEAAVVATATQLEQFIASGDITDDAIAAGLQKRLRNAQAALDKGNTTAAANMFGAFANHVQAQAGKAITEPAAETLVATASTASDYLDH